MRFRATLVKTSNTSLGIVIPEEIVMALSRSRRPAVQVTVNGTATWWTTLSARPEGCLLRINGEQRAGATVGQELDIDLVLDTGLRALPGDFALALSTAPKARDAFERLTPSHKQQWLDWILEAKRPDTRAGRVTKAVASLEAGKPVG
jgi:hypothetical protein